MKATLELAEFQASEGVELMAKPPFRDAQTRRQYLRPYLVKTRYARELMPIIQGKAGSDTAIYSDGFRTYVGLAGFGCKKALHGQAERESIFSGRRARELAHNAE